MKRSGIKRKAPPPGFPEEVRMAIRLRSGGRCEVQSAVCTGKAGKGPHHRKLRRHKDHSAENGLDVCDSCHRYIHDHPALGYLMGWLVHEWADPALVPYRPGDGKKLTALP